MHFVRMQSLSVFGVLNEKLKPIQLFGHIPDISIGIPLERSHYTLVILIINRTSILIAILFPFDAQSFVITFSHTTYR